MANSSLVPPSSQRLPGRLKFWDAHGGNVSPFHGIRDYVLNHGVPGPNDTTRLASELRIPEATVRGVATYYAEFGTLAELAVCDGTSCRLAGSTELCDRLDERGGRYQKIYCLGFCDRSPALMEKDGRVFLQEDAYGFISGKGGHREDHGNDLPMIRGLATKNVVTGRLLKGGAPGLDAALKLGAYDSLKAAVKLDPGDLLDLMERSGERGRGGAGFSTGRKWRTCAEAVSDQRYVIANGDEGDPGAFVDRVLMEEDPHGILEGMILCGYAIGATKGIVYIRSEYPLAMKRMQQAIDEARAQGLLGAKLLGTGFDFEVDVFSGMGSYVCGEETAMINAIEGLRGEVQIRPPYPAEHGLYGKPTVVNNVETLLNVPFIVREGAETYADLGTEASHGTKVISLNHGFANPGLVEIEFGITLHEVIQEVGGGGKDGKKLAAVILGGPMGSIVLPKDWNLPICYEALSRNGVQFGHGSIVALPEDTDFHGLLEHWIEFMVHESCGKCVPCSLGSQCAANALDSELTAAAKKARLDELFTAMEQGSLCAFGQFIPNPMRQLIEHFGDRIFNEG